MKTKSFNFHSFDVAMFISAGQTSRRDCVECFQNQNISLKRS